MRRRRSKKCSAAFSGSLEGGDVEILTSKDHTFVNGLRYQQRNSAFKITVLRTPENQGYGGNQKLGYRYAIDNGFDIVALVHGDGQYAPEKLPALLAPFTHNEAEAVFGSRMIDKRAARQGGMPAYKWIGNQILTIFQNKMLGTNLSEFHSGYRLYSTAALAQIPFEKNTNDFHFDTEIIIQFVLRKMRIAELPIPTFYGDEVCHVNGMKYAWDVFRSTVKARLCDIHLFTIGSSTSIRTAPATATSWLFRHRKLSPWNRVAPGRASFNWESDMRMWPRN
jgi:glycosyltransferase involved in cell wall biosynthesis